MVGWGWAVTYAVAECKVWPLEVPLGMLQVCFPLPVFSTHPQANKPMCVPISMTHTHIPSDYNNGQTTCCVALIQTTVNHPLPQIGRCP